MARQDNQAAVTLFIIRDGKMIGRDVYLLDAAREAPDDEVLTSFLEQYYARATSIPREIYVPRRRRRDGGDLETFLVERRGGPVHLRVPQRGEKRELLALAERNAARDARPRAGTLAGRPGQDPRRARGAGRGAGLPGPPFRIECYDISNFQGSESVGSMVVFEDGKPRTGEYRRFRIRTRRGARTTSPATRRCCGGGSGATKSGEEGSEEERRWAMPDLVIVDGGKPQVERREGGPRRARPPRPAAGRARQGARGAVPARTLRPDRAAADLAGALPRPAAARRGAPVRDHVPPRPARPKRTVRSAFDDLPGVGPKRKRELLKVFGSIKRVREAPVEQIAAVPGIGRALAERIKATLEA